MKTAYTGKTKIGIDLGWYDLRWEARTEAGVRLQRGGIPATPEDLRQVRAQFRDHEEIEVAYEAGPQMYWVHEVIEAMGGQAHPFHPGRFVLMVKSQGKSDRKDAQRIAEAAVKAQLPPTLYVPTSEERRLRERVREREAYRKDLESYASRLLALAVSVGRLLPRKFNPYAAASGEAFLLQLEGVAQQATARRYYDQARAAQQAWAQVEEEIKKLMKTTASFPRARRILESVAGIGYWNAVGLIAYAGPEAKRFATARQAAAYCGWASDHYQSGVCQRDGHISQEGPALVRRLLNQAAWAFRRSKAGTASHWGQWYWRKTPGGQSRVKVMITALSRKILCAAIACLKKGVWWQPDYVTKAKAA